MFSASSLPHAAGVTPPELVQRLRQRLTEPLPGRQAMEPWAPRLAYGRHFGPIPYQARRAAVAILLYPEQGRWFVPLTLRPAHLTDHAGQVSLPGGSLHAEETPEAAAWRELEEELGVPYEALTLLGRLTPLYICGSNFHVVPCLAYAHEKPTWRPSEAEVAAVIELPLEVLQRVESRGEMEICKRSLRFRAPCWEFAETRIWGASAMILGELAALLR